MYCVLHGPADHVSCPWLYGPVTYLVRGSYEPRDSGGGSWEPRGHLFLGLLYCAVALALDE